MAAIGRLRKYNHKGFAVVYIALMIVVLVAFVSLAVDLGYMYVAKGQLQNAADAAALAGATQLPDATKVKSEAKKFALANKAAGDDVVITDADVTLGNWDVALNPKFSTSRTPINAVKVLARRNVAETTAANQGMVQLFFGKIFSLFPGGGAGWPEMGTQADAIATHPPRPGAGILLCDQWCSPTATTPGTNLTLYWDRLYATGTSGNQLGLPPKYVVAFSEYRDVASTDFGPKSPIMQYINGTLDSPVAASLCGQHVYSNNAAPGSLFNNNGDLVKRLAAESTLTHPYWEVIAPLVRSESGACISPDVQGFGSNKAGERYIVTRFMKLRIKSIEGQPHPSMAIEIVGCIECSDIDNVTGIWTSKLVK
jgi:Flp pilus assembly protein TadG